MQRAEQGEVTVSSDELTGVQALERKHPGLPLAPGKIERREFEYLRHGTRSCIVSRDVVTGHILAPACGPTRTEADFLAHLQAVVASKPEATRIQKGSLCCRSKRLIISAPTKRLCGRNLLRRPATSCQLKASTGAS